jgi:hypothetical protein
MSSNQSIANTTISTQRNNRSNGYRQGNGNNNPSNPPGSHNNDTTGSTHYRNQSQGRSGPSASTSWSTNPCTTRNPSGTPQQQRPDASRNAHAFKGANDEMHGNIFGCSKDQCDRGHFTKTVTALQQVASKLPNSAHFQTLFKTTPVQPVIAEPKAPPVI